MLSRQLLTHSGQQMEGKSNKYKLFAQDFCRAQKYLASHATEPCLSLLHSDTHSNSSLAGDWSFLITDLGTIPGTYLAIRSPYFNRVGSLSRGVDRRKFSRFAIRRNEFLWTAASYPRWHLLIASKTLLWMGAAAAQCGLRRPSCVLNGERETVVIGLQISRSKKLSRFAIRRSEFLWTAASYPLWRSLIASRTLLWMGDAAALCGLKASVICGEWRKGRRSSMAWFVDCLLRLPLYGLRCLNNK
ncbi:hypothetical protein CEXT_162891 [Caerostris extrusa]|uniref:Uncharacterized protein n=1 Tax=Caerostris extrusa TaxID=172846 RepID=A0AAV4SIH8_CAEEX|nr:hypothetical protein CEXT_162891 [Caerostris extrusa]